MLARYSVRELSHHPLRTALAIAGIAVATATLVDMLMLGGGIQRSFAGLLDTSGYELRLSPSGTLPFDTEGSIARFDGLQIEIEAVEGVAAVAPVLAANVRLRVPNDTISRWAFALGVDPSEQGLYRLTEGRAPGPGEVVLGRSSAAVIGVTGGSPLELGEPGALGVARSARTLRVSALADFIYSSRDELSIALPLNELQDLTGRRNEVSFAMVRLDPGTNPDDAAARIEALAPRVDVVTLAGVVEQTERRLSYFRQLALILGTVSLFVTALLVGTIMCVSISDRRGTIAALRAIGVSRRSLLLGFATESLAVCALAGLIGLGLGWLVAGYLESILADFPGLPQAVRFFVADPGTLVAGFGLLLLTGAVAAVVPAWLTIRRPIALTLHQDEP